MKGHGCVRTISAVILLTCITACASGPREDQRQLPSYASPAFTTRGLQLWTVSCPLQTTIGTDDGDTSMFYKSDGTAKTLIEFCDEYDASSRIRQDGD
jgi:hypothetical protein